MPHAESEPIIQPHERRALEALLKFPLTEALFGRRSRRFALGGELPEGPLAYRSRYEPYPLSELERLIILTTVGGLTGWHNLISHHKNVAPYLPSYAGMAAGRTFPSAAGFHTSQVFFTDDSGTYIFKTRDAAPPVPRNEHGHVDVWELLLAHRQYIQRLSDQRLYIPPREPYMAGHNAWNANKPGSLLVWPVADVAQHQLLKLLFIAQNGFVLYDDVHNRSIPGLDKFRDYVAVDKPYPLTAFDQATLAEVSAEISTAVFAGHLMQQAMGLGGWMLNGLDRCEPWGLRATPRCRGWASATISSPAGRGPTPPASRAFLRATAPRITPACARQWRLWWPVNTSQAAPLTPKPPAPGKTPRRCAPRPSRTKNGW
jgi:hypothetical protein